MIEYTEEQKELLQKFEDSIQKYGSAAEAARQIGIGYSSGVISGIRKGSYEGKTDIFFGRLKEYYETKEQASCLTKNASNDYAETSVSGEIYKILTICQIKGGFAVACGDAGIGKTKAVTKYRKDHANTCISITMNTCFTGVKSLFRLLAAQVNAPALRSNDEIWLSIAERLSDGMILIIDEAQFLSFPQLEVLRSFCDYFESKGSTFGIALVGSQEIVSTMGNQRNKYAQIINRCEITKIYSTLNIQREDIQKIFSAIAEHEAEINLLWAVSKSFHGIRAAAKMYNTACQDRNCTYEGLIAAAEYMNINIIKLVKES